LRRDEARRKLLIWRPGTNQAALEDLARDYKFPIRWAFEYKTVRERLLDGVRLAALPLDVTVSSLSVELQRGDPATRQIAAMRLGWPVGSGIRASPGYAARRRRWPRGGRVRSLRKDRIWGQGCDSRLTATVFPLRSRSPGRDLFRTARSSRRGVLPRRGIPSSSLEASFVGNYAKDALKEIMGHW